MFEVRERGLSHCAAEVRRHDRDRWLTLLYAPPDGREGLAALYAFNLEIARVRERITDPMAGEVRLEWWRETVRGIYAGETRPHPVAQALARTLTNRPLPEEELLALVDGRVSDLYRDAPADLESLLAYADATGGRLSVLAARLCGAEGRGAGEATCAVGRAWALAGLLRAAGASAARRCTPVPETELATAGITKDRLFGGSFPEALRPAVAAIAKAAHEAIAAARRLRGEVPRTATSPCLLATLAEDYLARLARAGYDPYAADFSRGRIRRLIKLRLAVARGW